MQAGLYYEDNKSLIKINNSHEEHRHIAKPNVVCWLYVYFFNIKFFKLILPQ